MTIRLKSTILLLAALAGTGSFCTHDGPVAGIEVTNGDCSGTIYNHDSTIAPGAVVRLIPADYDPQDKASGRIDSTTTDKAGRYAFNVGKADFYNIIAEKDGSSSISESVPLQPEASVVVNDTLREPGKLAGRVSVKPEDDARNVVILIRGTNIYTAPIDSAGNFATPPLPAGMFTVQMVYVANDEYTTFDSMVTILPGITTEVFARLSSANAPPVNGLSVQYDSVTMHAALSWESADTSKIVSYVLRRDCAAGKDTVVMVDKSTSSYLDDAVFYEKDTIAYTIAAVGINFKEGYRSDPVMQIPGSLVECVKRVSLQYGSVTGHINPSLLISHEGDFYFADEGAISRMDSNGVFLYRFADTSIYSGWGPLKADGNGNIYRLKSESSGSSNHTWYIVKFDSDLKIAAEFPVSDTSRPTGYRNACMTVMSNGTIILFIENDSSLIYPTLSQAPISRRVLLYNADFQKVSDYNESCRYPTEQMYSFANQIIIKHSGVYTVISAGAPQNELQYLDSSLTSIMTIGNIAGIDRFIPSPLKIYANKNGFGSPDAGPGGLIFAYAWQLNRICPNASCPDLSPLLLICNQEGRLLARRVLPETSNNSFASVYFDNAEYFYNMKVAYPEVTVYKYSLQRLDSRSR